jgi:hypothetical protein
MYSGIGMNNSLKIRLLYYAPQSSQGLTIKISERGLSAQFRGHSETSSNPQFLQHESIVPFLRTHSFVLNNNFSPIRRDWGNTEKFSQRVNLSEKRKSPVDWPAMVAGKHEMITRRTERNF